MPTNAGSDRRLVRGATSSVSACATDAGVVRVSPPTHAPGGGLRGPSQDEIAIVLKTLLFVVVLAGFGVIPHARAQPEEPPVEPRRWGVMVYGGVLTDGDWKEALNPTRVAFEDSQFLGVAGSYTYGDLWDGRIDLEVEGAVIKHFGLQEHVEFTAVPLAARWRRFPWNDVVRTSIGLGGGFSYAARPPAAEKVVRDDAEQLLFHWYIEAAAGPADGGWEGIFRLHHRSGGFGLLGTQGRVGSDFLTFGVRRRF